MQGILDLRGAIDRPSGNADDSLAGRHVFQDDGSGSDYGSAAYGDPLDYG